MLTTKLRKVALLLTLPCLFFAYPGFAQDSDAINENSQQPAQKIYDIELILFKNISVPGGKELNLPSPSPAFSANTLDFSNATSIEKASLLGFSALSSDELRLNDMVQKIIRSSRYGLLSHTGWRQPGLDSATSIPVWIRGGQIFGNGYSSIDQSDTPNSTLKDENNNQSGDIQTPVLMDTLYEIEGQIIITLSRYLHTQANLVLRKPADIESLIQHNENKSSSGLSETQEGQLLLNYGMNEKRRMRSQKLHYLDHPQFGMLVLITPYEKPLEDAGSALAVTPADSIVKETQPN